LAGRGRVGQVIVEKRSLNAYVNGEKNRDREKAVEMARWSLRRGGRSGRFDCIQRPFSRIVLQSISIPNHLGHTTVQIATVGAHLLLVVVVCVC